MTWKNINLNFLGEKPYVKQSQTPLPPWPLKNHVVSILCEQKFFFPLKYEILIDSGTIKRH